MVNNKLQVIRSHLVDLRACCALLLMVAMTGCSTGPVAQDPADLALYQAAVSSPIRTDDDRLSDASRKPLQFLSFTQVKPGMQVLDMAAGAGNTTQLLALVVGKSGRVYAQGTQVRPALEKRLADHPQSNIEQAVRPFEDPIPGDFPLDLVTINLSYHDIANLPIDRVKMNRRLLEALKPGGYVVVIDHAARVGSGAADTKTLHRIDEALVRAEFLQAGFRLDATADYLRNPADTHEKKSFEMEHMTDRFALRFIKSSK